MSQTPGIDLGTTNSVISFNDGHETKVIEMPGGFRVMPSVVSFDDEGTFVGFAAIQNADKQPDYTYSEFKRLMGKKFSKMEDQGFQVVGHPETGELVLKAPEGEYITPVELSATILQSLVENAEESLGMAIDSAVITVPAGFNGPEREAVIAAGESIGLRVNILNEPTAAALAYGVDRHDYANVAVYDLGGGTFDVAIMEFAKGTCNTLSTNGNTNLGGKDFDELLARYAVRRFEIDHEIDLDDGMRPQAMARVMRAAERAKIDLTFSDTAFINPPGFIVTDPESGIPLSMNVPVTREQFSEMSQPLIRESLECCQRAMNDAKRTIPDIKVLILVGGMTRMPAVREAVEQFFNTEAEAGINPDEVVACGAAIKAAVLDHRTAEIYHQDVVSHSYGFRASGGGFFPVVKKGETFPIDREILVTSNEDGQSHLSICIVEGDHPIADENTHIATQHVELDKADAGAPSVSLAFSVDSNGLASVNADGENSEETIQIYAKGNGP